MDIRIGISGWTYAPWRGTFYPKDLKQKEELSYASRQVNSIEINGSFYSLQTPKSYQKWYDAVPDDFVFSIKAPRYITHIRRLKDIDAPVANFLASGILSLKQKLGPILWQFPPSLQFDPVRFESFFKLLPHDTSAASRLAKKHDTFLKESFIRNPKTRPLLHAVEIRHDSFKTPSFIDLLRKYKIAIVVADTAGKWPLIEEVTSNFVYVRLHGDEEIYVSGYTQPALNHWAKKVRAWAKRGDVYVYFDNDVKVRAPVDAIELARKTSKATASPARNRRSASAHPASKTGHH